ncbi:MAG: SET domain-containing protein-lysine N-methyltransferase [Patescibacteria group bacterium]
MFLLTPDFYQIKSAGRKGRGVFARRGIAAGTVIGDYLGRLVPDKAAVRLENKYGHACYAMDYADNGLSIFPLDIKAPGVHLINHSCSPNCDSYYYLGHTLYFALRHIFPGEELTIDYSFDADQAEARKQKDFLHQCSCGSPVCRGTMYVSVAKLKRYGRLCRREARRQAAFKLLKPGAVLTALGTYPRRIKDDAAYDLFANLSAKPLLSEAETLPTLAVLRRTLREAGRPIRFRRLGLVIWGLSGRELLGFK